jgi:hypothetical protein
MARAFIIFIEIAILVMALRTSFVQYFFIDVQDRLSNWMVEISQVAEQRELAQLRETYAGRVLNMSEYQQEYIQEITSDKGQLSHFYLLYCQKGDKNPFIYGAPLQILCSNIQNTRLLNS